MTAPACRECRFWQQFSAVTERGKCRRYAPVSTTLPEKQTSWPETRGSDDWCGEFAPSGFVGHEALCYLCRHKAWHPIRTQCDCEFRARAPEGKP